MRLRTGLAALSIAALLAAPAGAQGTDAYGTADPSVTTLFASAFTPRSSQMGWQDHADGYRTGLTNGAAFRAGLTIPTGARVVGVELDGCDADTTGTLSLYLYECSPPVSNVTTCAQITSFFTGGADAPGCARFDAGLASPFTVKDGYSYFAEVVDPDMTYSVNFRAVRLAWKRQVSAAPSSATFSDVPTTHFAHRYVEALARSGVTGGCGGGQFCPDAPLTRAQMAVFLATALGLHWPN